MKKVAFDIHGTLDSNVIFFNWYTRYLHEKGYKIYIITGGMYVESVRFLIKHKIYYDYFHSINYTGKIIPNMEWDSAKGKYCSKNKIDYMIDDSTIYGKYMPSYTIYEKW